VREKIYSREWHVMWVFQNNTRRAWTGLNTKVSSVYLSTVNHSSVHLLSRSSRDPTSHLGRILHRQKFQQSNRHGVDNLPLRQTAQGDGVSFELHMSLFALLHEVSNDVLTWADWNLEHRVEYGHVQLYDRSESFFVILVYIPSIFVFIESR